MFPASTTLTVLFTLCLFCACKREHLPPSSSKRLKGVISGNDSLRYTTFNYDAQNRLVAISDSGNNSRGLKQTYIGYNTAGNPVTLKRIFYDISNGFTSEGADSLIYKNNHVVKLLFKSSSIPSYKTLHTYNYDANGRLMSDTMHSYWDDEVISYTDFTYDVSDNIVAVQEFRKSPSGMSLYARDTILYNKGVNSYGALGFLLYFIRDEYLLLSRHNATEVTYKDGIRKDYTYEYAEEGWVKRAVVNTHYNSWFTTRYINFSYE